MLLPERRGSLLRLHQAARRNPSKELLLSTTTRNAKTRIQSHPDNDEELVQLSTQIESLAQDLWQTKEIPRMRSCNGQSFPSLLQEGEAELPRSVPYRKRAEYFRKEANKGCPNAQHSLGLLLWSGFGGANRNPEESAKYHAAAARQNHLDGMAVLGGCLRTGTGIKRNETLGLKLIHFCAFQGNPTGINKKAALLESIDDEYGALELYRNCHNESRINALLLFNLGWCLYNGQGTDDKHVKKGMQLWKDAAGMAPDEGSEEACWYLYEDLKRENPKDGEIWLDLAVELGLEDAIAEKASISDW